MTHYSADRQRAIIFNGRSWDCFYVRDGVLTSAGLSASERLARLWLEGGRLE